MSNAATPFATARLCAVLASLLLTCTNAVSGAELTKEPVGTSDATTAAPMTPTPSADDATTPLTGWKIVSISIPEDGEIKDAYVELKSPSGRIVTLTPGVSSKDGVMLARVYWSGSPVHAAVTLRKGKESVELAADASLVSKKDDLRKQPAQIEIESKFIEVTDAVAEHLPLPSHQSFMDKFPGVRAPSNPSTALNLVGVLREKEAEVFLRTLMAQKGAGPDGTPDVEILSTPRVTTRSQQRAVVEIIREFRFPTGFNPPDRTSEHWTPKDFVTRNLGVTLEVEPVLTEGMVIDLNVAPEVVEFLGFMDFETKASLFTAKRDPGKSIAERTISSISSSISSFDSKGRPYLPVFSTRKSQATVSIFPGNTLVFMGSGEIDDTKPFKPLSAGRQLIVLIRATIIDPLAPPGSQQKESAKARDESPKLQLDDLVLRPDAGIREAKPVEGKPGFVTSPYAPKAGYIDVRGFPSGTEVKCPYTGKLLRVP